jgi:transposase-like protein
VRNALPTCPNEVCENHADPPANFYRKKGYRRPVKTPSQKIPRYQCKACGAYFSATRGKEIHGQRRPDLNGEIFKLAVSGVSMRRFVALLGCHHRTVGKKITHLAEQAQVHHAERMKSLRANLREDR